MRNFILALLTAAPFMVSAQPPPGYYDNADGLSGNELRVALHDIIDGHSVLNYSVLWNYFTQTDKRTGTTNKVWDMYSDVPGGNPPYIYTYGTADQCGNYNSEGDCFNREHSFPKNWFNDQPPMDSDLHHLYPTDGYVNNKRGDLPYGEVGSADWTAQNGSKTGMNITQGYNGTVFEPRDEFKGDFARAYFYMMTRYWGQTGSWSSPFLTNGDLSQWAQWLLLDWNSIDPVSTKEINRNNAVYGFQHNRNPFIDNPQWAYAIWGPVAGVAENALADARVFTADGMLTVEMVHAANATLEIMDATGRSITHHTFSGTSTNIPLNSGSGLYFAIIKVNGNTVVKRFIL